MSPQQNMANGNWPIPQRQANWDMPTVTANQPQIPPWLQSLVNAYTQQPQVGNQMANPQYQAQPQSQQSQTTPPAQTLIGRHINNLSEIKPIEIPMDGTATYFPTFDGSSIYLRYWDQDGQIKGTRYVPEVTTNEVVAMDNVQMPSFPTIQEINDAIAPKIDSLNSRLNSVVTMIESLLAGGTSQNTPITRGSSKPKKEATESNG